MRFGVVCLLFCALTSSAYAERERSWPFILPIMDSYQVSATLQRINRAGREETLQGRLLVHKPHPMIGTMTGLTLEVLGHAMGADPHLAAFYTGIGIDIFVHLLSAIDFANYKKKFPMEAQLPTMSFIADDNDEHIRLRAKHVRDLRALITSGLVRRKNSEVYDADWEVGAIHLVTDAADDLVDARVLLSDVDDPQQTLWVTSKDLRPAGFCSRLLYSWRLDRMPSFGQSFRGTYWDYPAPKPNYHRQTP